MLVVVVVLALIAVGALVLVGVTRRRLAEQVRATAAAEQLAAARGAEVTAIRASLGAVEQRQAESAQRLAESAADVAQLGGVLWALEQTRSERTWRISVAPGPVAGPELARSSQPLADALQIELDAAREEVGTLVVLDAEIPADLDALTSVLVIRAAQELLAGVVRACERVVLTVRADGAEVVVTALAEDEQGARVDVPALRTPSSDRFVPISDGVRIRLTDPGFAPSE